MTRPNVGAWVERLFFWCGALVVVVPTSFYVGVLAYEHALSLGIYDPAIGGDPILRPTHVSFASALFLSVSSAQLASLLLRRSTLAGQAKHLRSVLAYSGLAWSCLADLTRTRPAVFPDIAVIVSSAASVLLLIAAVAVGRSRTVAAAATTTDAGSRLGPNAS